MGLRLDLNDLIASQAEIRDHFAGSVVFVFPAGEVESVGHGVSSGGGDVGEVPRFGVVERTAREMRAKGVALAQAQRIWPNALGV